MVLVLFKRKEEERVVIQTEKQSATVGILCCSKKPTKKTVVFIHGHGSNKDERGVFTALAKKLSEENFNSFRFDLRGHGEYKDYGCQISVDGYLDDLKTVIAFLKSNGCGPFICVGASFGAGLAIIHSVKYPEDFKALVLLSPLIRLNPRRVVRLGPMLFKEGLKDWIENIKNGERKRFIKFRIKPGEVGKVIKIMRDYKTLDIINDLKLPVKIIHGMKDNYIPYRESIRFIQKFPGAKSLTLVPGGRHVFRGKRGQEEAVQETVDFVKDNFKEQVVIP